MTTQERLKEMLSYNEKTGEFVWIKRPYRLTNLIGAVAGNNKGHGYIRIILDGKKYYAHRLAWFYVYGEFPKGIIDHIDGNPSNNRLDNLRCVNHMQNMRNAKMSSTNTSGVTGVTWNKERNKWVAQINVLNKCISLGRFDDKKAAMAARDLANKQYDFHVNHGR